MAARRRKRPKSDGLRWVPLGFVLVALLAAGLYFAGAGEWLRDRVETTSSESPVASEEPSKSVKTSEGKKSLPPADSAEPTSEPTESETYGSDGPDGLDGSDGSVNGGAEILAPGPAALPRPQAGRPARVAVVIDDLGRSVQDIRRLRALGVPLTYAVLPFETLTKEVVRELSNEGEEVLLHLPMEPANGANPGPGALIGSMNSNELAESTRRALAAVPSAVGVNNHMGSRISADAESMNTILSVIGRQRLYFLDSRTSAASVGYSTAIDLGLPAAERHVFLDGDPSPEAIREQFYRLLELASSRGSAIAIGHPYPETLAVLAEEVASAVERGFQFVPVSFLLDRPDVLPQE